MGDNDYIWLRKAWRIDDTSGLQFPKHNFWVPASPPTSPTPLPSPPSPSPSPPSPSAPGGGKGWVVGVVVGILVVLGLVAVGSFFAYRAGYINLKALFSKNYENVGESTSSA